MLGSNLGKKVTAGVVQDQYKQFLKNKPDEKAKNLTPEERKEAKRAEMRKRGIFVKADDVDEVPTVLEKVEGLVQPMLFVLPEKPTVWKKHKTGTRKNKKKAKSTDKKHESEHRKKPAATTPTTKPSKTNSIRLPPPPEPKATKSIDEDKTEGSEKGKKTPKKTKSLEAKLVEKPEIKEAAKKAEEKVEVKEKAPDPVKVDEKAEEKVPEPVKVEPKVEEKVEEKKSEEKLTKTPEPSVKVEGKPEVKDKDSEKEQDPPTLTSAPPTSTVSTSELKAAEQRDAFDKLDDDEFEKMTSDADEKDILKLAPKLLKVAKRHAAIEKCLTTQENDTLAKFFSGKQKLDAHVLAVLDLALDKIIDYLQKNNCAVDEETKAVMKKRDKLKAAMMKEFLVSPQYLPKTWTAKFNEWKSEAEKQKNGVNWFRVFFHYPKHKSFDDGPEDTFGNFRRRNRGVWIGILLGPGDVKSFEETKREDDCQGMFLDTKTIENATHEKDAVTGKNSQTSVTGEPPSAKK